MDSIVNTFIGRHIDLSKIVSISNAKFIDRMGFGGYYVAFEIHFQLLDKPIVYQRDFEYDEQIASYESESGRIEPVMVRGTTVTTLAELRLQKQINEIIQQWREYNKYIRDSK